MSSLRSLLSRFRPAAGRRVVRPELAPQFVRTPSPAVSRFAAPGPWQSPELSSQTLHRVQRATAPSLLRRTVHRMAGVPVEEPLNLRSGLRLAFRPRYPSLDRLPGETAKPWRRGSPRPLDRTRQTLAHLLRAGNVTATLGGGGVALTDFLWNQIPQSARAIANTLSGSQRFGKAVEEEHKGLGAIPPTFTLARQAVGLGWDDPFSQAHGAYLRRVVPDVWRHQLHLAREARPWTMRSLDVLRSISPAGALATLGLQLAAKPEEPVLDQPLREVAQEYIPQMLDQPEAVERSPFWQHYLAQVRRHPRQVAEGLASRLEILTDNYAPRVAHTHVRIPQWLQPVPEEYRKRMPQVRVTSTPHELLWRDSSRRLVGGSQDQQVLPGVGLHGRERLAEYLATQLESLGEKSISRLTPEARAVARLVAPALIDRVLPHRTPEQIRQYEALSRAIRADDREGWQMLGRPESWDMSKLPRTPRSNELWQRHLTQQAKLQRLPSPAISFSQPPYRADLDWERTVYNRWLAGEYDKK